MNDDNKGTPLIPDDMPAELDIEDLTIPTQAELEARQAKEGKTNDDASGEGGDKGAEGDNPDDQEAGGDDDEKRQANDQADAATGEIYETTLADPGDYQPQDYSFEVVVYDEEGKNGKTVKVDSVDQFEKLLDEEKNFGSASALLKAQRLATKMEAKSDADKAKWESDKADYDAQQQQTAAANEAVTQMASEIDYLASKGELPPITKQYQNANWSDPEVAKQPGVKERVALLDYMKKENDARIKVGLRPFSSVIDAFNQFDREQAQQALKAGEDKAGEARRQAGGRVAASTPAPASAVRKGVSVGRSFGDLSKLSDLEL